MSNNIYRLLNLGVSWDRTDHWNQKVVSGLWYLSAYGQTDEFLLAVSFTRLSINFSDQMTKCIVSFRIIKISPRSQRTSTLQTLLPLPSSSSTHNCRGIQVGNQPGSIWFKVYGTFFNISIEIYGETDQLSTQSSTATAWVKQQHISTASPSSDIPQSKEPQRYLFGIKARGKITFLLPTINLFLGKRGAKGKQNLWLFSLLSDLFSPPSEWETTD